MTNQLDEWVKGNYIHDTEDDICCPDFACCNKLMSTPLKVRERFMKAVKKDDESTIKEMLGMFLGQAVQTMGKDVYIAGLEVPGEEH